MAEPSTLAFIGGIPGGPELVVILLIAVLLFGAQKIPRLARSTGQAMGEFQRGREEIEQELEDMKETASLDADTDSSNVGSDTTMDSDTSSIDTSDIGADDSDAGTSSDGTQSSN